MKNIISLHEERIKKAIKEATISLCRARTLVSEGEDVPLNLILRLETVIDNLEQQLKNYIKNGGDR